MLSNESPTRRAKRVVKEVKRVLKNLEVGNNNHPEIMNTKEMANHITMILDKDSKACWKTSMTVRSLEEIMNDSRTEIQHKTSPTRNKVML
jgi:hypothetical protein